LLEFTSKEKFYVLSLSTGSGTMEEGPMMFTNNPKDYNRVSCLACMTIVKMHHMRKHLQAHGLSMKEYKEMYGDEFQYITKYYHKCALCNHPMLFDLDTLYNHVSTLHQIKVKDYVDLYLGHIAAVEATLNGGNQPNNIEAKCEQIAFDDDGAPIYDAKLKRSSNMVDHTILKKSKQDNSNILSVDDQNNRPFVSPDDAPDGQMPNCYKTNFLERIQDRDMHGNLVSNDFADYTLVECKVCHEQLPMTRLRWHTKSAHKITITEYKAQFGPDLIPVETIYHRCGICEELVLLDSDHIAVHLKKPGHNITHKNYNDGFMVDTRSSKFTKKGFSDCPGEMKVIHRSIIPLELNIRERSKRKKTRIPYNEAEYDLFTDSPPPPTYQDSEVAEFGEPTVVMENIEHDILDDPFDNCQKLVDENECKPPVYKSLQLGTTNKKLEVILLDGIDLPEPDSKKQVEEIVLDSDDDDDECSNNSVGKSEADVHCENEHIVKEESEDCHEETVKEKLRDLNEINSYSKDNVAIVEL